MTVQFKGGLVYRLSDEEVDLCLPAFPFHNVSPLHVTLVGFKDIAKHKAALKGVDVAALCADIPVPQFLPTHICHALKQYDGEVGPRITMSLMLDEKPEEFLEWTQYRDAVCERLLSWKPSDEFTPHITVWNNADGDAFNSIANPHLLPLCEDPALGCRELMSEYHWMEVI
jgi:hypothetical protein